MQDYYILRNGMTQMYQSGNIKQSILEWKNNKKKIL